MGGSLFPSPRRLGALWEGRPPPARTTARVLRAPPLRAHVGPQLSLTPVQPPEETQAPPPPPRVTGDGGGRRTIRSTTTRAAGTAAADRRRTHVLEKRPGARWAGGAGSSQARDRARPHPYASPSEPPTQKAAAAHRKGARGLTYVGRVVLQEGAGEGTAACGKAGEESRVPPSEAALENGPRDAGLACRPHVSPIWTPSREGRRDTNTAVGVPPAPRAPKNPSEDSRRLDLGQTEASPDSKRTPPPFTPSTSVCARVPAHLPRRGQDHHGPRPGGQGKQACAPPPARSLCPRARRATYRAGPCSP